MKTTISGIAFSLAIGALAGCAANQAPGMLTGLFDAKSTPTVADSDTDRKPPLAAKNGNAEETAVASVLRPKEIKKFSKVASVMLEKNCPQIVQPYRLTDNLATLGSVGMDNELGKLGQRIAAAFGGPSPSRSAPDSSITNVKRAAMQVNWLPMDAEKLYGERQHLLFEDDILRRESTQGKKLYPIADRMLADVLSGIKEPYDYQFQLFILKNPTSNALALPGGYIHIDQGLLVNPELHPKAYFAIGHEIAHVLQRHETIELQSRVVDSFTFKDDLIKTIVSVKGNPRIVLERVKVQKNLFTRHHMDQELQADSCATRMLSGIFPDQQVAKSLDAFLKDLPPDTATKSASASASKSTTASKSDVERLADTTHDIVETPIARHPNSTERRQNLRAISSELAKENTAQGR